MVPYLSSTEHGDRMSRFDDARRRVLEAALTLADQGYLPATGGNIALCIGSDAFAVTPSAADYYTLKPEDICVLDLQTLKPIEARRKPSVESGLHARLLRFRPDFAASIHTHQPIASAIALVGRPMPVTGESERAALGAMVPIVPYAPSGTWFLARAFEKTLRKDNNAYILRNHGIVCGGATMEAAMDNVRLLERVAARYLEETIARVSPAGADPSLAQEVRTELLTGKQV